MLNEGVHYQMGNLGREWEAKVTPTGKTVYENALAVSESKDSETFWVTLNVWEDSRDSSTALAEAVASKTGKGSRVIVRGKFSSRQYKKKDGTIATGWDCNVWDLGAIIRPAQGPSNFSSGSGRLGPADDEYKAQFKKNTGLDYDDDDKELPF